MKRVVVTAMNTLAVTGQSVPDFFTALGLHQEPISLRVGMASEKHPETVLWSHIETAI